MDPLDYYWLEEFVFPEEGGVTGTRPVHCPHCNATFELPVDPENMADRYTCDACGGGFEVDWIAGLVRYQTAE